jgi:predicted metal-dependent hydrolase
MRALFDLLKPTAPSRRPAAPRKACAPAQSLAPLIVECAGQSVVVNIIQRASARRMILRLDRRSGLPVLSLPHGVGRLRAERFVLDHLGWLEQRLRAAPSRIAFEDGALIPLFGAPCRITHCTPFRGITRLVEDNGERRLVVHGNSAQVAGRVERFLKAEALRRLTEASERHAKALGVTHGRITIKDTRSRWGSCSARGELAYSWRMVLAPPLVLDYLAAHEICHRKEMNHSMRYWRHVASIFPRFKEAEHWLKREGANLHRYG